MNKAYQVYAVGVILKIESTTQIQIFEQYADALLGLDQYSHLMVLYWFHESDRTDQRKILQVHPRGDDQIPLTGVFATHSPVRPNPIAISVCRKLAVTNNRIHLDEIDAFDGSPVIDIKPYIPKTELLSEEVKVAEWI